MKNTRPLPSLATREVGVIRGFLLVQLFVFRIHRAPRKREPVHNPTLGPYVCGRISRCVMHQTREREKMIKNAFLEISRIFRCGSPARLPAVAHARPRAALARPGQGCGRGASPKPNERGPVRGCLSTPGFNGPRPRGKPPPPPPPWPGRPRRLRRGARLEAGGARRRHLLRRRHPLRGAGGVPRGGPLRL